MRSKLSWIGSVEARDAGEAREKALKQLDIRPADQFRVTVRRESAFQGRLEDARYAHPDPWRRRRLLRALLGNRPSVAEGDSPNNERYSTEKRPSSRKPRFIRDASRRAQFADITGERAPANFS